MFEPSTGRIWLPSLDGIGGCYWILLYSW